MAGFDESGTILDLDGRVDAMFGYRPEALLGRHVSVLIPTFLDNAVMVDGNVNSLLAYICNIGAPFQIRQGDGSTYSARLLILDLGDARTKQVRIFVWR